MYFCTTLLFLWREALDCVQFVIALGEVIFLHCVQGAVVIL